MSTNNEKPSLTPTELLKLIEEGVHALSDGFAIFDSENRLVFANDASQKNFSNTYDGMRRGLSYAEAHLDSVRKALPEMTDEQHKEIAKKLTERMEAGKPTILLTVDGRPVQTIYRRMSGGRRVAISADISLLRQKEKELAE